MKIPKKIRDTVTQRFEARSFPKKQTLLEQGEVSCQAYYVDTGCLRMWHNDDGNDISVKFFFPVTWSPRLRAFTATNRAYSALKQFCHRTCASSKSSISSSRWKSLPNFNKEILGIAVACMADYQNLFLNQITGNAEDRFRLLMHQDPCLLEHVPQHYIASYLGITPVSLSRLRKKIPEVIK